MLFIKANNINNQENNIQRMPAMVYVKQKDGTNQLQLREIDDIDIPQIPFKNTPYIPGLTEGNTFSPVHFHNTAIKKIRRNTKSIQIMPEILKSKSLIMNNKSKDISLNI